jgi:chromate reductase
MPQPRTIAVIVGSLRRDSLNRKVALELARLAPAHLKLEIVEIGDLPLYNQDLETESLPAAWTAFREKVAPADGVLFVTPEYNRSIPGALKNAIDVGSRPYGHSVWAKKPGAVISVSPGAYGGFGANHHLRQSTVFLDIPLMQQPEAYLAKVGDWFGADGTVTDERHRALLAEFIAAYADWVEKILRGPGELADDAAGA